MCDKRKKNKKKKTKKLSQFLKLHFSGTREAIRSILECGVLKLEGMSTAKTSCFIKEAQSYGGAKIAGIFLPVNILTGA